MRPCWMSHTGGQPAPEMNNYYSISDIDCTDYLIVDRGVTVNRFMYRNMQRNNLINASNIVTKAIYECCI